MRCNSDYYACKGCRSYRLTINRVASNRAYILLDISGGLREDVELFAAVFIALRLLYYDCLALIFIDIIYTVITV